MLSANHVQVQIFDHISLRPVCKRLNHCLCIYVHYSGVFLCRKLYSRKLFPSSTEEEREFFRLCAFDETDELKTFLQVSTMPNCIIIIPTKCKWWPPNKIK